MIENQTLYSIIILIIFVGIIYFIIRFLPENILNKISITHIFIIAMIIIIIILLYICKKMLSKVSNYHCPTCKIDVDDKDIDNHKSCRVVCDTKKETFTNESNNNTRPAVRHSFQQRPVNNKISQMKRAPRGEMLYKFDKNENIEEQKPMDTQNTKEVEYGYQDKNYSDDYNRPDANAEKNYWRNRYGTNKNADADYGGMFYDENPYYNRYNNDDDYLDNKQDMMIARRRKLREDAYIKRREYELDDRARTTDGYEMPYQDVGIKSEKNKMNRNKRVIEDTLDDELPYSDYNQLPVASGYKSHDYEYGYSFLPPEKWYPQPPRPPVCVTEKRCPVCPVNATGTPTDVKEFHNSRRITQPDEINVDYVNDKLNSGR